MAAGGREKGVGVEVAKGKLLIGFNSVGEGGLEGGGPGVGSSSGNSPLMYLLNCSSVTFFR